MANRDQDLIDMGMSPQEIAYINTMARSGGLNAGAGGIAMQMQNDTIARNNLIKEVMAKRGTGGAAGGTGSASNSSSSSYSGIQDQEVRDILKNKIKEFNAGGTAEYQKASAERADTLAFLDQSLKDYSKQGAFQDAGDLMAQNLRLSMEKNMPAIQRAQEGAGTSGGAMQALLSQKLATESSQAAGALGANQASEYGRIAASMLNTRAGLTQGVDRTIDPMVKLADSLKVQTQNQSSMSNFNPYASVGVGGVGTTRNTTGPAVYDTVANQGVANGGGAVAANPNDWYAKAVADLNKKTVNYGDTGYYTEPNGGGFGANWYDQARV